MKLLLTLSFCLIASALAEEKPNHEAFSKELIDYVNSKPGNTWKAGENAHFKDVPLSVVKGMMGVKKLPSNQGDAKVEIKKITGTDPIPESFDSRTQWPKCLTIQEIRDQAACGSCWAVATVEAISDRICIHSNAAVNKHISAEDLMCCCKGLFFGCGMGCDGGEPSRAWAYYTKTGIVTGGNYGSKQGCQPYQIPNCDHHTTGKYKPCGDSVKTPACEKSCIAGYNVDYTKDKQLGSSHYALNDVESIQREIMTNGPVGAAFTVYADFPSYKSGVYQHTSGSALGGHAVKIIGWGVDNSTGTSTPYWTVANSWNTDWGDAGFFKIIRGKDDCGFEDEINAGIPKY